MCIFNPAEGEEVEKDAKKDLLIEFIFYLPVSLELRHE